MSLAQTIRGALLTDFLGALVVATREVFTRKATQKVHLHTIGVLKLVHVNVTETMLKLGLNRR